MRRVNITGASANAAFRFADFHRLPGDTPELDTNLQPGELITSVDLAGFICRDSIAVPEGARPRQLRLRTCLRGCRAED